MLTESQKQLRKNGLGGSDIAAILGLSPYKTPIAVYLEKIGETQESKPNKYMTVGNYLEPAIIKMYEDDRACKVISIDTLIDKDHPFLIGNVDGKQENKNIIVEVKTARKNKNWGEPGTNEIPAEYLCQVAHYAYLANCEKVDIAVLFVDSRDYVVYTYERNEQLEKIIRERAINFWNNHVIARVVPDVTNADDLIFKELLPDAVTATSEIELFVQKYRDLNEELKQKEIEKKSLREQILMYMNNHQRLVDAHNNLLSTYVERNGSKYFNIDKFSEDHPDLFDKYIVKRPSTRVFTVK
jgi:putative phage-type endonuclease